MRWKLENSIIEVTNRYEVLENFSDGEDINRAWENIKENVNFS